MPQHRRKEIDGKVQCIVCKEWFTYDKFYIKPDGRPYSLCIPCSNEKSKKDKIRTPDKWYQKDVWASRKWAKDHGTGSTLTSTEWKEIVEKYEFKCYLCGKLLSIESKLENTISLEHIIPLSRGGTNSKENVAPACKRCNFSKNNMTLDEFIALARKWIGAKL